MHFGRYAALVAQRGGRVVARLQADVLDRIGLAEKPPRCVIVLGGQLGTGDAIVGSRYVEDREGLLHMRSANEAGLDVDGGACGSRKGACRERGRRARRRLGGADAERSPSRQRGDR